MITEIPPQMIGHCPNTETHCDGGQEMRMKCHSIGCHQEPPFAGPLNPNIICSLFTFFRGTPSHFALPPYHNSLPRKYINIFSNQQHLVRASQEASLFH